MRVRLMRDEKVVAEEQLESSATDSGLAQRVVEALSAQLRKLAEAQ